MKEASYNAKLDKLEAAIKRDYIKRAAKMTGSYSLADITAMVRAGDAVSIFANPPNAEMLETIRAAYVAGGIDEVAALSKREIAAVQAVTSTKIVEFKAAVPAAQAWVANNARDTVTVMASEQAGAVQAVMSHGQARGEAADVVAKRILGLPGPGGVRTGGVAGLSTQDAQFVENARTQLMSGDPAQMRGYFDRVRRDRRYDKIVERAIAANKPVAKADIDKITARYADRLMVTRAESTASIEALGAYNAGREQFYEQLREEGYSPEAIQKKWRTRGDAKVRDSHRRMNGQTTMGGNPFVTPRGARLMHPGDMSLGAPLREIVRCRCRAIYSILGGYKDDN